MIRLGNYIINKTCIEFIYVSKTHVIINLKSGEIIKEEINNIDISTIEDLEL